MTISEIRRTEASLEAKAAAVSNFFPPIYRQAFESTLSGVLGKGSYEAQKQAAYDWMDQNYEIIAAVVYASIELSEQVYQGLCDLDYMLMKIEKGTEAPA